MTEETHEEAVCDACGSTYVKDRKEWATVCAACLLDFEEQLTCYDEKISASD